MPKKRKPWVMGVKSKIEPLEVIYHRGKTRMATVPKKIKGGFVGMNLEAARSHHIPANIPYNEVVVWQSKRHLSEDMDTMEHEMIEKHLMRYYHLPYRAAHKIALKYESTRLTPKKIAHDLRKKGLL